MGMEWLGRLDGHTVCATLSLLCLLLAMLSAGAAQAHEVGRRALHTWAVAMACGSGAFALYMGRGTLPWLLSFHLGNAMAVTTPALAWMAHRQLLTARPLPLRHLAPLGLALAALVVSAAMGGTHAWVITVVCGATSWLMAGTGLTAATLARRQHIAAAWLTVFGVCTTAISYVVRTVLSVMPDGERLVAYGPLQSQAIAILILSTTFAVLCTIGILGIVAELRHRHWQDQMRRDALTGVLTRSAFFEQAEALLAAGRGFSVLMIDVDHFKAVNDQHGHATGDAVLTQVARRLDAAMRSGDLLGRYGGEEFCALLPDAGADVAAQAAARLVAAVGRTPLRLAAPATAAAAGESTLACTVSVGHATWPTGETVEADAADEASAAAALSQALQRADQALYRAKRLGRNRSVAAPGGAAAAVQPPWPGRELTQ